MSAPALIERAKRSLRTSYLSLREPFWPCLKGWNPIPGWTPGFENLSAGDLRGVRCEKWRSLRAPFCAVWWSGIRVMIYPNDETSRCLYTEGYYEPNQICFLRSVLRPGMTFLDIGAHSGVYSLVAALSVGPEGRILSVEPSRREFQKLRLNLQLNKFTAVDVTQAAVSDRNGEMTLKIAGEPHTGHNTAGSFSYPGIALVAEETVKCLTIDELVLKKNLERVDVIKLDIEGSEFAALTGAASTLEKYRPVVLFENPDKPGCGQEPLCGKIWDLLTSKGYRLFRYGRETGLPEPCASYPGTGYSDFIALPSAASRE